MPEALNHSAADLSVRLRFEVAARATIFSGSPLGHRQGAPAESGNTHGGSASLAARAGQAATMRSALACSAARSRRACTVSPPRPANTVVPPAPGSKQNPDPGMASTTSSTTSAARRAGGWSHTPGC